MSEQNQHSDELFETLSKNKKMRRRKVIRTVLILLALAAAALVITVFSLRRRVDARFAPDKAEVLSHQVSTGTIHTTVSGSGVLTEVDRELIEVPTGVEITEVLVENRDPVAKGDVLATVDMASVMTALSDLQEQMEELDGEIADAKGDTVSSYIRAGISGRVKVVYAESGMDVSSCMAENGALAVLSLDGYMAVDLEAEGLTRGGSVTVRRPDGSELEGIVESAAGGKATVLVTDNGPEYDEEVTALTQEGEVLGSGKLYVHSPLAVTGYAGTVSTVSARENTQVYSNTTLFTLKDTSFSANYDTLLRSRSDLEETLLELLTIYRDGAVLSPMDAVVTDVAFDPDGAEIQTEVLTLYPNVSMSITISIDETDILALEEGQEAEVVVSSVSEDVLTGVVTEISKEATTSSGVTVYSAEITVDRVEGMLSGMTAEVDVKIEGTENALIIPLDALHQTSAISYVYTTYDQETQRYGGMVEVTTGMQNDNYVEILSGLKAGDTVYYTEQEKFFFGFGFGNMGGMGNGGMSGMPSGSQMPGGMGGARPDMGGRGQGGQP